MESIYNFTFEDMQDIFIKNNNSKYRADQCFSWLYRKYVDDFSSMTNLSKPTLQWLEENFSISQLSLVKKQVSKDKTIKYLFKLEDGSLIETVLMHFDFGKSVCITSQIGCNMGCKFCASGLLKKKRNLTTAEMVLQILYVEKELAKEDTQIKNIVIMGIGEPFDNYDNVMKFCRIINHDKGIGIGARHITISTCGLANKIYDFADERVQYNLAISLHAPNDELRSKIMPINKVYNLNELMKALDYYSSKNNRRLTFEYILLKDINDKKEHAIELANLLRGKNAYVNLIPYNQVDEHGFKTSDEKTTLMFYDTLMKHGVKATLRSKHGDDIDAACGQLRAKHERVL